MSTNIFQHLGLDKEHRSEKKTTQLVKHWDDVIDSNKKGKVYAGQLKEDGVHAIVVVGSADTAIFSRTGRRFTNVDSLETSVTFSGLRAGIYMAEMCCDNVPLMKMSGVVNPNRVKPLSLEQLQIKAGLRLAMFDLVSVESFVSGSSQTTFWRRHANLQDRMYGITAYHDKIGLLELTYFPEGNTDAIERFADHHIEKGEEGIVIRDLNAGWEAGHKGWRVMKKVRGVSYDCLCVGIEEGKGKYEGKAANLLVVYRGQTIPVMLGKGWTHDDAAHYFTNPPIGTIFEVYALEESSKGKLRNPKIGEKRHDKCEPDFVL